MEGAFAACVKAVLSTWIPSSFSIVYVVAYEGRNVSNKHTTRPYSYHKQVSQYLTSSRCRAINHRFTRVSVKRAKILLKFLDSDRRGTDCRRGVDLTALVRT